MENLSDFSIFYDYEFQIENAINISAQHLDNLVEIKKIHKSLQVVKTASLQMFSSPDKRVDGLRAQLIQQFKNK